MKKKVVNHVCLAPKKFIIKAFVKENPDAYLNEIASHFNFTTPAIHAALKRLNITRKKSPRSIKSDVRKGEQNI